MAQDDIINRAESNGNTFTVYRDETMTITPPAGLGVELDRDDIGVMVRCLAEAHMLTLKQGKAAESQP